MQRHQEYDRLRRYIRWWSRRCALAAGPRADEDLICHAPMRERDGSEQRRGKRAGNSREHYRCESPFFEKCILFPATAIDIRIALLEAEDCEAFLQCFETERKQFYLSSVGIPGEFAGNMYRGTAGDEIKDGRRDEFVGKNYGRRLDGFMGSKG